MRRMMNENAVLKKPQIYFEDELLNVSEVLVNLEPGMYVIEFHDKNHNSNLVFINISEDNHSISTYTHFNFNGVGSTPGYFAYDKQGQMVEILNPSGNPVTVSGHIDIYKF